MAFDFISYILSKKYIDKVIATLPKGFIYKGSVSYKKDLPTSAEVGDVYTVLYTGEDGTNPWGAEFVYSEMPDGSKSWLQLGAEYEQQLAELKENVATLDAKVEEIEDLKPEVEELENNVTELKEWANTVRLDGGLIKVEE